MTSKKCKKFDFDGKELDGVEILTSQEGRAHPQSIKDYIKALRENARQWSANTKDRSQSNHSGAKPHAQKGTGKARQGFLGAPQYKGGGRVHTPKPKFNQHVKINRKERRSAISTLLTEKIENDRVIFLKDDISSKYSTPKTAIPAKFLKTLDVKASCLFISMNEESEESKNFQKSLRNIPKVSYKNIDNLNGYIVVAHQNIIVIDSAEDKFKDLIRG